jgi:dissimilatory sulfite reductase related protein
MTTGCIDAEGYVTDPALWTEALAEQLARDEGIALTPLHWDVIRFMRAFQEEHQLTPDARFVIRFLARDRGFADTARDELFRLFPYGYVKQACRIAGMKRPRAWSTG